MKRSKSPTTFKPGQSGNPAGRTPGSKNTITEAKVRIMARTGMLPLDFLTAVYRDALYEDYVECSSPDGKATYYEPKPGAPKIKVDLNQRLSAASCAAPYVHRKMPVGVEVGRGPATTITADKLRQLSSEELERLLELMDRLGIGAEFEGFGPRVYDEDGRVVA